VRGSVRICVHHTRKRTPSGSSGAGSRMDGKRPALVSLGRPRARVCIILLTQRLARCKLKIAARAVNFEQTPFVTELMLD
jgi:hypothetical protein